MDTIDWSGAPPSATHYSRATGHFYRHGTDQWAQVFDSHGWWTTTGTLNAHMTINTAEFIARPAQQPVTSRPAHLIAEAACQHMRDRAAQYDQPQGERSMGRAVTAFNSITGRDLTESEGWLLLQVLKDVRQWQNPSQYHQDSAEDCIAYAALKAESLEKNHG